MSLNPPPPFANHVELLSALLDRGRSIVERIESRLLNVQGRDAARIRDYRLFQQPLETCIFDAAHLPSALAALKGQLAARHVADGFEPVPLERTSHELNPGELIVRALDYWERHRWPGRNGRLAFARAVYAAFMLRQLEALSLRIWDDGTTTAGERLAQVQSLLDRLNEATRPTVLVRDARWLLQTAQGPLTRHLAPYFRVADRIGESFTDRYRLGVHRAGAALAGGHLRSQLRFRSAEMERSIDDPAVLAVTRNSNSMDAALLVRDLLPLLDAYWTASRDGDTAAQSELADVLLQGVSADPELFITRLDLLEPCTAIDYLFVDRRGDGSTGYTPLGAAHREALARYRDLMSRTAAALLGAAAAFDPSQRAYSSLGIAYGFCADVLSTMALSTLVSAPDETLALEDLFDGGGDLTVKLAAVRHWERGPVRPGERERFEYSVDPAVEIFERTRAALQARAERGSAPNASGVRAARLFVVSRTIDPLPEGSLPADVVRAQEHCVTSDVNRALATGATAFPRSQFLNDRHEGRYLASCEIDGKWFGVSKTILTEVIGQGADALVTDVPERVLEVLRVTCPGLLVVATARSEDPTPR